MTQFDKALFFTLQSEGGKSDDKNDRGGRTNQGVTQMVYDAYRKRCGLPKADVYDIDDGEVRDLYRTLYWNPCKCEEMPESLAIAMFDCAVNCGVGASVKFLQRVLGTKDDGVVGPKTMTAVKLYDKTDEDVSIGVLNILVDKVIGEREKYYNKIVELHPDQTIYSIGWQNRCLNLRRYIGID